MNITAFYAALLAPLFIYLSLQVIRLRRSQKVAVGDGGNKKVLRAMRVQANFAEYVPFTLLLMAFAESLGTPAWFLHILGLMLLAGRGMHAYGVSRVPEPFSMRVRGMQLTFLVIALAALAALYGSFSVPFGI
jgi:hypothetical protein